MAWRCFENIKTLSFQAGVVAGGFSDIFPVATVSGGDSPTAKLFSDGVGYADRTQHFWRKVIVRCPHASDGENDEQRRCNPQNDVGLGFFGAILVAHFWSLTAEC